MPIAPIAFVGGFLKRNVDRGRLSELLSRGEPLLAPGAYDCLSARLVEQAGFEAVYMTGFGASASLLGLPDIGLLSFGEMLDQARRMVQAVGIPVIADADSGYGNAINVIRTVREYETVGVAAIQLEDQLAPKRCGHLEGKRVIAEDEMVGKIRAAVEARTSKDCLIIARTDARSIEGLDRALARARRYHEAGADVLFVDAPQSEDEVAAIAEALPDVPRLYNWLEGGKSPPLSRERLKELGFRIVIFPLSALTMAIRVVRDGLVQLRAEGTPKPITDRPVRLHEVLDVVGFPEIRALGERFSK